MKRFIRWPRKRRSSPFGKVATEHFHDMLNCLEGMEHARQVAQGARRGN